MANLEKRECLDWWYSLHLPTLKSAVSLSFKHNFWNPRRIFCLSLYPILYALIVGISGVCRWIDPLLFSYRATTVEKPIFILANPRSGTTFMHRLMSIDPQFIMPKMYQTLWSSVLIYKVVGFCNRIGLGFVFSWLLSLINWFFFASWQGIHTVDLQAPEEDENIFFNSMLTPAILYMYPYTKELNYLFHIDQMKESVRKSLGKYYFDWIQGVVYAGSEGKILLAKNTHAGGRMQCMLEIMPDIRIVSLVRHPYEAIPSMLSMFSIPLKGLNSFPGKTQKERDEAANQVLKSIVNEFYQYYRVMIELKRRLPFSRMIEIQYRDLIRDPEGTVHSVYERFGLEMSDQVKEILRKEINKTHSGYKSVHKYTLEEFGLTRREVYDSLRDVFEEYGYEP